MLLKGPCCELEVKSVLKGLECRRKIQLMSFKVSKCVKAIGMLKKRFLF